MEIIARIMHVPARPWPDRLIAGLAPFGPVVVTDTEGLGPWNTAKQCWLSGGTADYILVVQDDVELVPGFCDLARAAIVARPQAIISFFYHDSKAMVAAGGASWIEFPISNWGPALCMPAPMARDCVEWNDQNIQQSQRADDLRVLHYATNHGLPISATNPSLVEHRPEFASTVSPRPDNREFMASKLYRGEQINWSLPAYRKPGDIKAFLISRSHHRRK